MLDFCIFVFLSISVIIGFLRGFKKEFNSIVSFFLFIVVSFFYANFIGSYVINFLDFDLSNFPDYSHLIFGCIIIFLLIKFFVYVFNQIFLDSRELVSNLFFDKFFGLFFGFVKGVVLLSVLFSLMVYYENLHLITDFDNNSQFLDYFLEFGVQLRHVWNHWYS